MGYGSAYSNLPNCTEISTPPQLEEMIAISFKSRLRKVTLNKGLKRLLSGFRGTNLTLLDVPETVEVLSPYCMFGLKNFTVICHSSTPPANEKSYYDVFKRPDALAVMYVPDESVDLYKASEDWTDIAERIKPLSEYEP